MASLTATTPLASSNRSGRLRYASAQELPSFPSIGLRNDGAAASAAATLGWANQKSPPGLWKPDSTSNSASTAALLANDKMAPASDLQRAQSTAGSQAAIMAASSSARRRETNHSSPPSLWGSSAANLAFKASLSPPPQQQQPSSPTLGTAALSRQNSMRAAQGAMAMAGAGLRPRAISSPMPPPSQSYPDRANAATNALGAATIAHRPSMRGMTNIPIEEAGAVPYTTMNRQMFTSNPPVKPETDEQKRNDVLHASALAMAKRMYNQQQQKEQQQKAASKETAETTTRARQSSFSRHGEPGDLTEEEPIPIVYGNLQEAAYRLAQERLAKLQDEHQKNRDLQQYYGAGITSQRPSKFGEIRNKLTRRRSLSDGDLMMEDQVRSRQIRKQMSLFNTKLMEVDERKRAKDREALLAAAQRNVKARLQDMDNKIQAETTGGLPGSGHHGHQKSDWEWKAHAAAQARFDAAHNPNQGKIDLGGGKFMDKEEVDQIAAKKVQPLLDEINKNAEREYERRMQQKADEERRKEEEEKNKAREREIQAIHKKLKDQQKSEDKVRKAEIKQIEKNQREQAKAAKAEQKRLAKDGKGKEREKEVTVLPMPTEGGGETAVGMLTNKEEEKDDKLSEPKKEKEKAEKKSETTAGGNSGGGLPRALSIKFHKAHGKHGKEKEPKGKEREVITTSTPAPINTTAAAPVDDKKEGTEAETVTSPSSPPLSATTNKVKTWIKSRFHNRSRSKYAPSGGEEDKDRDGDKGSTAGKGKADDASKKDSGFIGGVALARLSAGSCGGGADDTPAADDTKRVRVVSPTDTPAIGGHLSEDDLEPHRDSMREVALAGRVDYLTDPDPASSSRMVRSTGDEKGESSRSVGTSAAGTGAISSSKLPPAPVPVPVPVPIPVVITTSEVDAQPETATIVGGTTSYNTVSSSTTRRENRPALAHKNTDGVSAESTDQEDEGEGQGGTNGKIFAPIPLRLNTDEISAVARFGNDWDTTIPSEETRKETRRMGVRRSGSVSSLSSTDLSDELDTEDEDDKGEWEKFKETKDELERPRMPPRVSSADVIGVVEDDVSVDGRGGKGGGNPLLGLGKYATKNTGTRSIERGVSPYRESRFSEDL